MIKLILGKVRCLQSSDALNALATFTVLTVLPMLMLMGCFSEAPQGLMKAKDAKVTVVYDLLHRPLPNLPLPNDLATRYDPQSATTRRINASMVAPTELESSIRTKIDQLDGWGMLQPITIPFSDEIDVQSILDRHRDVDYDPSDDVLYLIDITPNSPEYGQLKMLDIGQGNYPIATENRDRYFENDPRKRNLTIWLEEADEDLNQNGVLDRGEDTDGDGVLDRPNYFPAFLEPENRPADDDLGARYDATMTFYERQTHTLFAIPVVPLRPRTSYAVLITKRLKDLKGNAVGSPFELIHHSSQSEPLKPLPSLLEAFPFLGLEDVAFAFTYTTQSSASDFIAVRDGLYSMGVQKHIGDNFPPVVTSLEPLKDEARFPGKRQYLLYAEEFAAALNLLHTSLRGLGGESLALQELLEANKYVDYFVMGSFEAPQLSPREDAEGNPLKMNDQSWPTDLDRIPAPTRSETVYFTLIMPRKEVSVRGEGKPAPVVLLGHGHTGNRFDAINIGPYFARHGLATLAIDNPGHGIGVDQEEREEVINTFKALGVSAFAESAFKDRSRDLNFDGELDTGADYWDFYLFHTRDNVRQTALDYMSIIRLVNSFDGRPWANDLFGDQPGSDIAGDFDGDGVIDIGLGSTFTMSGGSLGGIMAMLMGTVEPHIKAIAPIVGAGGLGLVSRRSINQNVRNAILSRAMGPFYLVTRQEDGSGILDTLLPDLTERPKRVFLSSLPAVEPQDTIMAHNLTTGEKRCGVVNQDGQGRVSLPSDLGDKLEITIYEGNIITGPHCKFSEGAKARHTINKFEQATSYWDQSHGANTPLAALAEGLGHLRSTPDFRRFVMLGPLVMDRADPAVMGRHLQTEPLVYGTGEQTGAHALITTGTGDLNVPVDGGATFARAAGILKWRENHPDWEVPENQVLIDHYILECIDAFKRYTNPEGKGVLIDPDNFSNDQDYWAGQVPRLDPPLRVGWDRPDHLGGRSSLIHAYGSDEGRHGFDEPGVMTDRTRARCAEACTEEDGCACDTLEVFDVGNFHFNLIGAFLKSAGQELEAKACHATYDCEEIPPVPEARALSDL